MSVGLNRIASTQVVLNLPTYSVLKEECDAALFGAVR